MTLNEIAWEMDRMQNILRDEMNAFGHCFGKVTMYQNLEFVRQGIASCQKELREETARIDRERLNEARGMVGGILTTLLEQHPQK